jgi:hypothetical protein
MRHKTKRPSATVTCKIKRDVNGPLIDVTSLLFLILSFRSARFMQDWVRTTPSHTLEEIRRNFPVYDTSLFFNGVTLSMDGDFGEDIRNSFLELS